jgi:hypothetical protein
VAFSVGVGYLARGVLTTRSRAGEVASRMEPGLLTSWNPSECERHHGRGQRKQHGGERERTGPGAQQLAVDPA